MRVTIFVTSLVALLVPVSVFAQTSNPISPGSSAEKALSTSGGAMPSQVKVIAAKRGATVVPLTVDPSDKLNVVDSTVAGAIGTVGSAAPASNVVVAGKDGSGNTQTMLTNVAGDPQVDVISSALPAGAATAAKQDTGNTNTTSIDGKLGSLGQKTMAGSAPVVISSDQSALPASQSGTWSTRLQDGSGSAVNKGQATMSGSLPVVFASDQGSLPGRSLSDHIRNSYSSTNVTTAAYVQVTASIAGSCNEVDIFDSSGQTLVLAVGGSGSEVDQLFIVPGGNGRIPAKIASGSRVSLKAVSATANAGEFDLNCYN